MMRQYEIAVAVMPTKSAGEHPIVKRMVSWVGKDSELKIIDTWEKYALAYPIRKQSEASFLFVEAIVDPSEIKSLNDHLQHDDEVLRHIFIRDAKKLKTKSKAVKEEVKEAKEEAPAKTEVKEKKTRKKNTSS